jgi:hypothetical protein
MRQHTDPHRIVYPTSFGRGAVPTCPRNHFLDLTVLSTSFALLLSATGGAGAQAVSGQLVVPSDSDHYEYVIYTAPLDVQSVTVTATVTWAADWSMPSATERTSSFPNLVSLPYRGGFGCDFIRNHADNNFVEFESGMDPRNPGAMKAGSITVGPGISVAIAGSDCFFDDNFRFHRLVEWTASETPREFSLNFTTFIQGNSVIGPPQARCGAGQRLHFSGDTRLPDPNATSFRTRQTVTIVPDEVIDIDGVKDGTSAQNLAGVTKSFAPDALPVIDASDEDYPDLGDCHLLHEAGQADTADMSVTVSRVGPHAVRVDFFGSVGNPLVVGGGAIATIDWELTLVVDMSSTPATWTLSGTDDGFPSWELYINEHPIYLRNAPPPYSAQDLRWLLRVVGDSSIALSGVVP